jgi:hypothetical protein
MNHFFSRQRHAALLLCAALALPAARAQAQAQPQTVGGFRLEGEARVTARAGGVRIEGANGKSVRIFSPQLDVAAPIIAVDIAGSTITQVRAQNGVVFKANVDRRVGGKASKLLIEARAGSATLDVPRDARRTLKLTGGVDGFYEVDGGRSSLKGTSATLSFGSGSNDLQVEVEGGPAGVTLSLASQMFGAKTPLGDVSLSGARAVVNQVAGIARFSGASRIRSNGMVNGRAEGIKLDVSAAGFEAKMSTVGGRQNIASVQTQGRATVVLDLPPAPAGQAAGASSRPVRLEVSADTATVEPGEQKMLLSGNVRGNYVLRNALGRDDKFEFSGDSALVRVLESAAADAPLNFELDVVGKPVGIDLPAFDFSL